MYFKIRNNILFRQYEKYGYITDNSMFGYRLLNDTSRLPGEKYVSESASVMLSQLKKTPQNIDDIVNRLFEIFTDIDYYELKKDTIDFYMQFVEYGFLSFGETAQLCLENEKKSLTEDSCYKPILNTVNVENCSKNIFSQNDFLRSIHIEIANVCNERCVHCYIPHEFKTKVIDTDLLFKILEQGRSMNIINVTLSGGEPLIHKDIIKILNKCRDLDLSVNILSNLTLLDDDIIFEINKNPLVSVQTSIYSMNPIIHDSITKVSGSFELTKSNLLRMHSEGIPVQISCPVMKQNKDSFTDVVNWGKEHNIGVSVDYVIFAAYDHSNSNLSHRLSLEEVSYAIDKQLSDDYADMMCLIADEKNALTKDNPICSICRYNFCVSVEGDVFPCVGWQTKKIGNLNNCTIKEIWEDSEEIRKLREIKREHFPRCVSCEDRGYCTVCMMSNSNENPDGNEFLINDYHCKVASLIHNKVDLYKVRNK